MRADLIALLESLKNTTPEFRLQAVRAYLDREAVSGFVQQDAFNLYRRGEAKVLVVSAQATPGFNIIVQVQP